NVNTVGYKSQRVSFKDSLAQQLRAASSPSGGVGGTNPVQIGLGVQLNSTDTNTQTGAVQATGNPLDAAIQGDGWFRIASWDSSNNQFNQVQYTRVGTFATDTDGYLVANNQAYYLVGYTLDANGNPTTTETRIQI